jgi:hypothetical protein
MTLANGHANGTAIPGLTPFTVHQAGPALSWPPPPPEQPRDMTVTEEVTAAVRDSIDGDKVIRLLTAFVVLAVAAFAAVVSYSHIFDLGHLHGQDGTAARLLPLSVDGLIAAASLVMLHAARNKLPVPPLSRLMLALGVGATVAANVAYGLPFGWLSAVVSAWPAAAFVGSVEMAIRFVSDARSVATAGGAGDSDSDTADEDQRHDDDERDSEDEQEDDDTSDTDRDDTDRDERQRAPSGSDRVRDVLRRRPALRKRLTEGDAATRKAAKTEAAEAAGVTVRTVERVLSTIGATP